MNIDGKAKYTVVVVVSVKCVLSICYIYWGLCIHKVQITSPHFDIIAYYKFNLKNSEGAGYTKEGESGYLTTVKLIK